MENTGSNTTRPARDVNKPQVDSLSQKPAEGKNPLGLTIVITTLAEAQSKGTSPHPPKSPYGIRAPPPTPLDKSTFQGSKSPHSHTERMKKGFLQECDEPLEEVASPTSATFKFRMRVTKGTEPRRESAIGDGSRCTKKRRRRGHTMDEEYSEIPDGE